MIRHPSMSRVRWVPLLTAIAALLGCAVGQHYKPPVPVDGAQAPLVSLTPTAETAAQPPDDWWRLYHDALLDQFLQERHFLFSHQPGTMERKKDEPIERSRANATVPYFESPPPDPRMIEIVEKR